MTTPGSIVPVALAGLAWRMFTTTAVSVAEWRCRQTGVTSLGETVGQLRGVLTEEAMDEFDYWDDDERPGSLLALEVLTVEMAVIAFKYREVVPGFDEFEMSDDFETLRAMAGPVPAGDPMSDQVIDDFETVTGSIEKLLEKLPKWMKRVMEVAREVLRLTRGFV